MIQRKRTVQWHPVPLRNQHLQPALSLISFPTHSLHWTKVFSPIISTVLFSQPFCPYKCNTNQGSFHRVCVRERPLLSVLQIHGQLSSKLNLPSKQCTERSMSGCILKEYAATSGREDTAAGCGEAGSVKVRATANRSGLGEF